MSHSTLVGRPPQSNLMNSFNLDMYSPASAPLPPPPPPLPPSSSSRTDQILSRYRPIAPKPLVEGPPTPENAQQSPFSRNLSYLLTRPSRNRKRAKSGCLPASKRPRITRPLLSSPCPLPQNTQLGLSLNSTFPRFPFPTNPATGFDKPLNLVTLPYLPYPSCSSVQDVTKPVPQLQNIPMYSQFQDITDFKSLQEMDLLQNLHASDSSPMKDAQESNVITPQAVRPVGSSIFVECIEEAPVRTSTCVLKKPEEVEMEIELDTLPAVVSDSSNRIRLTNSAYMEMVGQPECLWLGSMAYCQGKSCSRECNRIAGKVRLDLSNFRMPVSSDGFTCRAKIEWGSKEEKRAISTRCDVVKLSCVSRDYLFAWRFHTREDKKSDSQV